MFQSIIKRTLGGRRLMPKLLLTLVATTMMLMTYLVWLMVESGR